MQISLLSQNPTPHWLAGGYNHINMDFINQQIMLKDLDKTYRIQGFSRGVLQYPKFAVRQSAAVRWRKQRESKYWNEEVPTFPPVLHLLLFSEVRTPQP
jgi:hybrid polyketide synthase/nonribosomal peptide synthetase ACE1